MITYAGIIVEQRERDAHAKAKNRRNQSSSTSALYLGFVSASLLSVYSGVQRGMARRFRPASTHIYRFKREDQVNYIYVDITHVE